jgi:predicted HicB family RNase H-like nuclease
VTSEEIHLRLPRDLNEWVRLEAKEQNVSINGYVTTMVAHVATKRGWRPAKPSKARRKR